MDLKKRLGNLFILGFSGPELVSGSRIEEDISERNLGGVILFDRNLHNPALPGNITSPQQLRRLTAALRNCSSETLLIGVDQEGGLVQRLNLRNGFSATPSAAAMGSAAGGAAGTSAQAEQTAQTLAAAGINLNFAPVVDLNSNRKNPIIGRIGRSFAEEPETVIEHAWAWICAHKRQGVVSCLKHFPGHGSSAADSHLGFVDISASWQENELTPYRELIKRGAIEMVMAGHLFNRHIDPVYPAPLSHATITGLLRQDLGFAGVVLTDDIQMKGITDRYDLSEVLCRSFAAGIDMIVIGNNLAYAPAVLDAALAAVLAGLRQGSVSEERLYSALDRVQKLKTSMKGR